MRRIKVACDGATGMVGRTMTKLLEYHPYFELVSLIGHTTVGRSYGEVFEERETNLVKHYGTVWKPAECPNKFRDFVIKKYEPRNLSEEVEMVLSAVPGGKAKEHEEAYANLGLIVVSNARDMRMVDGIPLVVGEVNHEDLADTIKQPYYGCISTDPNCSSIGFCLPLKPVDDEFAVISADATTSQALSGKGDVKPGDKDYAHGAMLGTVHTEIKGEREKMESEPYKIMHWDRNEVDIVANTNRVYVQHGHMERIRVKTKEPAPIDSVIDVMIDFNPLKDYREKSPMTPEHPIVYRDVPNTRRDLEEVDSMTAVVGKFRQISDNEFGFMSLTHNLVRGAAGAALQNAELFWQLYYDEFVESRKRRI